MRKEEGGYIVVETITSFMLFLLLNISILSLINIVVVQARIHYAITQTAETLSMYSYSLDLLGLSKPMRGIAAKGEKSEEEAAKLKTNIYGVIDGIKNYDFKYAYGAGEDTFNQVKGLGKSAIDDPKGAIQQILSTGVYEGANYVFGQGIVKNMVEHYLANGNWSGDEYLRAFQVKDGINGLHFYANVYNFDRNATPGQSSVLLTSDGTLRIVVTYEIEYTFGGLPLPFKGLQVSQAVETKAWLSGNGEGYHG